MTKRELWVKLFSENDTALMAAIILAERFVNNEYLETGKDYIQSRKHELDEPVSVDNIKEIFPSYVENTSLLLEQEFVCKCRNCKNCIFVNDLDGGHWECTAYFDYHGRPFLPDLDGFCSEGKPKIEGEYNDD